MNKTSIELAVAELCDPQNGVMTAAQVQSIISLHCIGKDQLDWTIAQERKSLNESNRAQVDILQSEIDQLKEKLSGGAPKPVDFREVED